MDSILIEMAKTSGPHILILIVFFLMLKSDMKELKSDVKDIGKTQTNMLIKIVETEGEMRVLKERSERVPKLEQDVNQAFSRLREVERRDS